MREIMKGGVTKYLSWVLFQILRKAHANKYKASQLENTVPS